MLIGVYSCGDSSVESNPPTQQDNTQTEYTGPAPQTEDIQKYKTALWNNISPTERCGGCHTEGAQAPFFADRSDVNKAYSTTTALVDLTQPSQSRLVTKVANGHNCWLDSEQACGETMQQWIKLWADDRVSVANTIELTAPVIREPGSSKNFPDDASLFNQHLYPILSQHCIGCHNESSINAQSPFFASSDVNKAYDASKRLINLNSTSDSRLVIRLAKEFHNCWNNCQQDSLVIQTAIDSISNAIDIDNISSDMVISKALRLTDGIAAASGGRFESDVIGLYQFKTGNGNIAYDTSGIEPAANLTLTGDVEWLGGWGLTFNNGKAQASTANSKKFHDLITATHEFSLEAWLTPSNVVQEGPARIVSYSAGDAQRNFTLGQTQYNYDFLLRSQASNLNGEPALSTPANEELLQATLQHVVITYSASQGKRIYVNGKLVENAIDTPSPLASWDDSFALILGREASNNHHWQGNIRLLAIYNRALLPEHIEQNYQVGVGEKFYLLFSIGELIDLTNTYILFEASQFDNYSYLFNTPQVINLEALPVKGSVPINKMRIGLNGKESTYGQAYENIAITLENGESIASPKTISPLGTTIIQEKGANLDEFFLTFEQLGEHTNIKVPGVFVTPGELPATTDSAKIGMRNFAQINASMSVMTGVEKSNSNVSATYALIKQQLPTLSNIETFISAQQMAITQLAIAYCDAAFESDNVRNQWFPNVNFNTLPNDTYDNNGRLNFIIPLLAQLMPENVATHPERDVVSLELNELINRLSICESSCPAERSLTIAKSSCAAVLASAVMLVQ